MADRGLNESGNHCRVEVILPVPEIDMQQAVADKIFENICEFLVDLRSEPDNL